ncbi:CDP-diacylglycerol--serine O-phosphatidyltransferase [Negadavirga shengliensis]|uniref:CDP-diacylglycerol--serine O-phosphatidyltransferase n=1 Tax=Negadavirga shengliensis TaxID=1389218 RepID=A0ABV9T4P3_9BACT
MNIKQHIPNFLTCLNLVSGMLGIYFVFESGVSVGAYFIFAAALFDFLDGLAARVLKVHSEIGKQLDSLADLVTFGVLPSFIVFFLVLDADPEVILLPFLAFFIGIQSALRLAKFNIDERQSDQFIGLPTPANALFFSTLPFLADSQEWAAALIGNIYFLLGLTVVFSLLLTAELPLLALKFKKFGLSDNKWRYLTILMSCLSILIWGIGGIPFAILSYICISVISYATEKNVGQT